MAESGGIRRRFGGLSPALRDRRSPCKRSPHRCRPLRPAAAAGPVAQWLEPAAHNGLVAGSSPAGPTNEINNFSRWLTWRVFLSARNAYRYDRVLFALWFAR